MLFFLGLDYEEWPAFAARVFAANPLSPGGNPPRTRIRDRYRPSS